jgi:L-aspartate oxidase
MPSKNQQPSSLIPEILILGTGIAGLSAALKFAQTCRVTLVSKVEPEEGSTRYAQGGIASVWSKEDSFDEHKKDTHTAGAGLCHEAVVDLCVREGPARVQELIDWGVEFTRSHEGRTHSTAVDPNAIDPTEAFDLHREGGHSQRRILHADDLTGWAIEKSLLARARENPRIEILDHHVAIDLITEAKIRGHRKQAPGRCLGAYVLDSQSGKVSALPADITVLASGGAGKVYLYTSNPDTATGDGIAMAHRAGAKVANLEFMQFHPTCLFHPAARNFLISEALRGEGAVLRNASGEEFVKRIHPLGSLAPRDIVARAIDMEMKRTGEKHMLLDATLIPAEELKKKFPNIYETCLRFGIDITATPIPVVPACHYTCGGVQVDEQARTSIEGLYAVGEVACTGLHGANRLASNSLLEAVVFAHQAFLHGSELAHRFATARTSSSAAELQTTPLPAWDAGRAVRLEEQIDIAATWFEIRSLMWNYVGIVRSDRRLGRALRRLENLKQEIQRDYWDYLLTRDLIELRNLVTVAELIVRCALTRKESRGLHYTVDYPEKDDRNFLRDTVI